VARATDADSVAGEVAVDVARQLADPVRALRDRLGLVVDHLERHVATSTGPTPYPWRGLQALRQDLAAAYLEATHLARRLDELDRALGAGGSHETGSMDVGAAVDLGLRLAGHHLASVELVCDLGDAPPARGEAGTLAMVVAQMLAASARSTRALAGSALSVRVHAEDGAAVVVIADNGAGDEAVMELGEVAGAIAAAWGASVAATSATGRGCVFELRFAAAAVATAR
jgi:signal transduction histidine kinase